MAPTFAWYRLVADRLPARAALRRGGDCWLLLLLLVGSGCTPRLDTTYGRMSSLGLQSVNGTRVLADLFSDEGHRVQAWTRLSPRLKQADVIVWFPDDFEPPKPAVRDWLDDWLFSGPNRTLIYVGRDFDAAPRYWQRLGPLVPAADQQQVARERRSAETDFQTERAKIPARFECEWFDLDGKLNRREVRQLAGPWSTDLDAAQVEIELNSRLLPVEWATALLESGDDVLVGRVTQDTWDGSQFITVANGSFLLNMPLVNHEHRKLAGKLVAAVGPPAKQVVFLESRAGGPPIFDKEPGLPDSQALAVFGVWPLSGVLLHLAVLGLIFAFARWPIFGRPQVPPPPAASDFGKHVTALGQLLARTRDRAYALSCVGHWRDTGPAAGAKPTPRPRP